ncbi:ANTAR domain-containing protein [Anaerotignum lactatifermentans]|uniref:ANTAR domain-containing protein n=1 Tax=Anaerotignum lactatifermentans TaxID=160404 RepID=A0ABS2GA46_9FIRM|nr:ANTAR domain-containing protein [Anaerotignum lactatifermentans]MBM6829009.1 ANTAR domain-containing protein [Anaerotignum lactatifermentans]MBM6877384.1 ANTAR domain-containing protein [Anaerotignum lactatifermentans]MBM6950754.1 ANTAR domain-containing protein [Anaerotignum lactatifermentans]
MNDPERLYSMLTVSAAQKFQTALQSLLPPSRFHTIHWADSVSAAKRQLLERTYDFIVIHSPLNDDFGIEFAMEVSARKNAVVLLTVRAELYEEVYEKISEYGIFLLPRPASRQTVRCALDWMVSMRERLGRIEEKTVTLSEKMEEIRLVNRAKWVLIDREGLSEPEAHRRIEKAAMDQCLPRREIARAIIEDRPLSPGTKKQG